MCYIIFIHTSVSMWQWTHINMSHDSSVRKVTGHCLDDWVSIRTRDREFSPHHVKTGLGPNQPPIQWVQGTLSLVAKRPGREADHSPPSSAEDKEWVEPYLHLSNTPSWRGAQLRRKHRDNLGSNRCCIHTTLMGIRWKSRPD